MSDSPNAKRTFNSEEEMWDYIEEQEDILNRLGDVFAKAQKPSMSPEGIAEWPTSLEETERLAMSGDPASQFNLSIAYCNGDGVSQDFEKAASWMQQAAERGFAPAQYNIGCHWRSQKIKPHDQEAYSLFKRAAEQNFGPAQFNLGIMCGNAKNYVAAYMWFYLAEQNRVENAKENRNKAAAFLGKDDLNTARLSVSAWMMDFRNRS